MKTRRFIAVFAALTMAAAIGSTGVFAAEPTTVVPGTDGNPTPESAGFEVKYDVDPSYTVTIPAGVDITTEDKTDSITLNEGALLEEGSKIKVVLEKGANTTSGNSFTAKTASGNSSASYQITQGENTVSVGDTVASLDKDTLSASLTFSKTETVKPTYAGTHAEVLTFTISTLGGASSTSAEPETLATNTKAPEYTGTNVKITVDDAGDEDGFELVENGATATIEALNGTKIDKIEVTEGYADINALRADKGTITIDGGVATISDINDTSLVLSASFSGMTNYLYVKQVKVYFVQ